MNLAKLIRNPINRIARIASQSFIIHQTEYSQILNTASFIYF